MYFSFLSKTRLLTVLLLLVATCQFSYSQEDWAGYAAHQECIGRCYDQNNICEFDALRTWFDCWRWCYDHYGPNSGPFSYSPYNSYYHEGCESACDYNFDQAYYYCDIAFDRCECGCIRSSAGWWGQIFGIDC
jgi:hypothetical protein